MLSSIHLAYVLTQQNGKCEWPAELILLVALGDLVPVYLGMAPDGN